MYRKTLSLMEVVVKRENLEAAVKSMMRNKRAASEAIVTTVLYDKEYEIIYDRTDIKEINRITDKEYFFRGTTVLPDAIRIIINKIDNSTKKKTIKPIKLYLSSFQMGWKK